MLSRYSRTGWVFFCIIALHTSCCGPTAKQLDGVALTIPYHVVVSGPNAERAETVLESTFREIDDIFNAWNPASELCRLNSSPSTFSCSQMLFSLLELSDLCFRASEGAFDPTVAPAEKLWRKAFDEDRQPTKAELEAIAPALGWRNIELLSGGKVRKKHPQTVLDLGGIAKGFAVELLAKRLAEIGLSSIFVEWGGEVATVGNHPDGRPWRVGIFDPYQEHHVLGVVETSNSAVATSGHYRQFWLLRLEKKEHTFFHIFDTKTGLPREVTEEGLASVTVQHESCAVADALATIILSAKNVQEAQESFKRLVLYFPTARCWVLCQGGREIRELGLHPGRTQIANRGVKNHLWRKTRLRGPQGALEAAWLGPWTGCHSPAFPTRPMSP